ncbi:hypothetical protein [Mycoplasma zalophi]|uniref:Lipoprotein n=1 Tax=Mycoplasma zalophi TaxID=191287 RepID=A0ABS6DQG4_9MOLU|nr:hypothetical protein [Mycoplasma zalophi]MBU4690763.1 hypothetical protein [Mycoplasma zalophi]MBU4692421.1 hypothetical protein [Mycoplasma zalophi]
MKKILNKKYLIISLISLLSLAAVSGVVYYVYYNAKITHVKKYSKKEYEKDQNEIKLSPSSYANTQSAQQIFNNFNNWKQKNPKGAINNFVSQYVNINLTPRQVQNIDILFTDLKFNENDSQHIMVNYSVQDKKHKFKKIEVTDIKIPIWNNSFNYENDQKLKEAFEKYKPELQEIISSPKSSENNYFSSEEFKNNVFEWFKKIANENRPNLFPEKDYDITKTDNEDYVKYTVKNERNLLVIDFNFVSKDKKTLTQQRIQYYVN